MLYLAVALISVIIINLYIAINKKMLIASGVFLGAFTIPIGSLSFFFVSAYVNGMAIPMPWFPIVPLESLYIVLVACTVITGLSIVVYVEPGMLGKTFRIGWRRHVPSMPNTVVEPPGDDKNEKGKGGNE